jgi:hypothetical protein
LEFGKHIIIGKVRFGKREKAVEKYIGSFEKSDGALYFLKKNMVCIHSIHNPK